MLEFSEEQRLIREETRNICEDFDDEYWREIDREARYPMEFVEALGENGWLGTVIPGEYGGVGLDTLEAAIILEEVTASGAGFNGAMACHGAMFIPRSIINYGDERMKEEMLPKLASGEELMQCFALTEPNAGFDSTSITTFAREEDDTYVVNGQKVWCSRLHASDWMVLVARTTPKDAVEDKTDGISLFLVDINDAEEQGAIDADEIEKNIRRAVPSYQIWFEDLDVPKANLIGEKGNGFYQVLVLGVGPRVHVQAVLDGREEILHESRTVWPVVGGRVEHVVTQPGIDGHQPLWVIDEVERTHDGVRLAEGGQLDEEAVVEVPVGGVELAYDVSIGWGENTVHGDDQGEECVDSESNRDESETRLTIHGIGGANGEISGVDGKEGTVVGVAVPHKFL